MDVILITIANFLDDKTLIAYLEAFPGLSKTVLRKKTLRPLPILRKIFNSFPLAVDETTFYPELQKYMGRPVFVGNGNFTVVIDLLDLANIHYPYGRKLITFKVEMEKYSYRLTLKPFLYRIFNAVENGLFKPLDEGVKPQDGLTGSICQGREKFYFSLSDSYFDSEKMVFTISVID